MQSVIFLRPLWRFLFLFGLRQFVYNVPGYAFFCIYSAAVHWPSLRFRNLWIYVFHQIWEDCGRCFLKYSFALVSSSSFLDSNHTHVSAYYIAHLSFPSSFFSFLFSKLCNFCWLKKNKFSGFSVISLLLCSPLMIFLDYRYCRFQLSDSVSLRLLRQRASLSILESSSSCSKIPFANWGIWIMELPSLTAFSPENMS